MIPGHIFPAAALAAAALLLPVRAPGQSIVDPSNGRPVTQTSPQGVFDPAYPYSRVELLSLEHRDRNHIAAADAALLSARMEEIGDKAAVAGYGRDLSGWHYEQVCCPVLPHYLIFQFTSPVAGARSRFSAAFARAYGPVYVVPGLRSGNLPLEESREKLPTAVFAELLAGEQQSSGARRPNPDWIATGLCFAELNGDHPTTVSSRIVSQEMLTRNVSRSTLFNGDHGEQAIEFTDAEDPRASVRWRIEFSPEGRPLAATRTVLPLVAGRPAEVIDQPRTAGRPVR